ncbi:hypothetical protein [Faecalibacillus intestinalis]|uniref:YobI family P-loop NTPase n=1 Tax=Faecalibacillus intestinalis TaxID=1982626 RepID=UPI0039944A4E
MFTLLKDDTFISKDRTKFFDFIIPVIPVVDSSNSYNKLKERFQKMEFWINLIKIFYLIFLYISMNIEF